MPGGAGERTSGRDREGLGGCKSLLVCKGWLVCSLSVGIRKLSLYIETCSRSRVRDSRMQAMLRGGHIR